MNKVNGFTKIFHDHLVVPANRLKMLRMELTAGLMFQIHETMRLNSRRYVFSRIGDSYSLSLKLAVCLSVGLLFRISIEIERLFPLVDREVLQKLKKVLHIRVAFIRRDRASVLFDDRRRLTPIAPAARSGAISTKR